MEAMNAAYPGLECADRLDRAAFKALFEEARIIVAHAGIGSILSAKAAQKPLVLLPRRYALGTHRTYHQIAPAK